MNVESIHNNPKLFCELALSFLMENESENNLLVGVSSNLARIAPQRIYDETYFWIMYDGPKVTGVAMLTPPHDLVLSHPFSDSSLAALAESIVEAQITLPGVLGPNYAATKFADMWAASAGSTADLWRKERIYRLAAVEPLQLVAGNMIRAGFDRKPLLATWIDGFMKDTGEGEFSLAELDSAISDGRLFIWYDGKPTSMAAWTGPTPNGVRISMVYTPPELRRRGYATAVVGTLSSMLLQQGKSFCSLYTDLSNPTSNSIYQQIGYKPILDCYHYRFVRRR